MNAQGPPLTPEEIGRRLRENAAQRRAIQTTDAELIKERNRLLQQGRDQRISGPQLAKDAGVTDPTVYNVTSAPKEP